MRGMDLIDMTLRRRRLEPPNWQVRAAFSPLWSLSQRWWSLALCVEGVVAIRMPAHRWLPIVLRAGLAAGAGGFPSVHGDSWPLDVPQERHSIRGVLFPRSATSELRVIESRCFWCRVHVASVDGSRLSLTFADPTQSRACRERISALKINGGARR